MTSPAWHRMVAAAARMARQYALIAFLVACRGDSVDIQSQDSKTLPMLARARICNDGNAGPVLRMGPSLISGGHVSISGTTSPGASVYVNGVRVDVQADGTFVAIVAKFALKTTVVVASDATGCSEWYFDAEVVKE